MTIPHTMMQPFPPTTWRLLLHPPRGGAWNMAADEAILEAAARGDVPPTLRFYAWEPACLSLGYAQPYSDVDETALRRLGWDVVRRPTGGRAILHTDELTYSVAGPESDPRLAGGVLPSYRTLSMALLDGLRRMGLPAEAHADAPASPAAQPGQNPVCFEVPSHYEITAGGKKLIGSAQRRSAGGVLQHGSLPLRGDLRRITQALVFSTETSRLAAAERLLSRAITAEGVLGRTPSWDEAAAALQAAFAAMLNLELAPGELSAGELQRADALERERYAAEEWTVR